MPAPGGAVQTTGPSPQLQTVLPKAAQTPPQHTRERPRIHATALLGMDADTVEKTLGPPQFIRHDLQAQIWQYAGAACVLDLFLYPPSGTTGAGTSAADPSTHTVLHIESHTRTGAPMPEDRCLQTLDIPTG